MLPSPLLTTTTIMTLLLAFANLQRERWIGFRALKKKKAAAFQVQYDIS